MARTNSNGSGSPMAPPRLVRRPVDYPMVEFVRPGYDWLGGFSIEQAFGLMRDAIARGIAEGATTDERWGVWRVTDLVSGGSGYGDGHVAFKGVDDLRRGFQHLVLGSPARARKQTDEWRERVGITPGGTYRAAFPHYTPMRGTPLGGNPRACENDVRRTVEELLGGYRGKELAVSLNPVHLAARTVGNVSVIMSAKNLWIELEYRLESSHWFETLAVARGDEPFSATLDRAASRMRLLMGEETKDAAELCLRLNQSTRTEASGYPRKDWVLGTVPVQTTIYTRDVGQPDLVVTAAIGYGAGCARIVALPSGRPLLQDATYDYARLRETVRLLLDQMVPGMEPTPAEVLRVYECETSPVKPLPPADHGDELREVTHGLTSAT